MGPASTSALRAAGGADPDATHGAGDDPYGSLTGLGGPRKFKKKPVLVLDPEELERAHLMFQEASAELLGEEVERPARPASILGLAAMDDEDFAPEDLGEIDEELAGEEDEALPAAEEVLRLTTPRAPVETDPDEEAFAVQMLEEGLDLEHRIFPSLPMKSEEELAAEEAAELAALHALKPGADAPQPFVYAPPEENYDEEEAEEAADSEAMAALPPLALSPAPQARVIPPAPSAVQPFTTAPRAEATSGGEPPKVPSAYVPQIPPPLPAAPQPEQPTESLPLPEFGWNKAIAPATQPEAIGDAAPAPAVVPVAPPAPLPTPTFSATPTFDDWDEFDAVEELAASEPLPAPEPESEPEPEPEPEPVAEAWQEPEWRESRAEPTPEWSDEAEPGFATLAEAKGTPEEPAAVEDEGSWTAIEEDQVDGYAFMYASQPRVRSLRALAEGEANSLRARLLRERQEELARAEERRSQSILARWWNWLRGLFG